MNSTTCNVCDENWTGSIYFEVKYTDEYGKEWSAEVPEHEINSALVDLKEKADKENELIKKAKHLLIRLRKNNEQ